MPVQFSTVHSTWPGTQQASTHFAPQSWGQPCQLPQHLAAHGLASEHARVTALYHDVSSRLTALQQRHAQMEDSHSQCNAINFELHQLNHVLREKCDAEAERGLRKLEALEKAIADLEHENACRCSNTICCSEATPNGTNATLRCFKSTEPRPKGESRSIRPSRRLWLPCDAAIQSYGAPRRMIYRSRRTWRNT